MLFTNVNCIKNIIWANPIVFMAVELPLHLHVGNYLFDIKFYFSVIQLYNKNKTSFLDLLDREKLVWTNIQLHSMYLANRIT